MPMQPTSFAFDALEYGITLKLEILPYRAYPLLALWLNGLL